MPVTPGISRRPLRMLKAHSHSDTQTPTTLFAFWIASTFLTPEGGVVGADVTKMLTEGIQKSLILRAG